MSLYHDMLSLFILLSAFNLKSYHPVINTATLIFDSFHFFCICWYLSVSFYFPPLSLFLKKCISCVYHMTVFLNPTWLCLLIGIIQSVHISFNNWYTVLDFITCFNFTCLGLPCSFLFPCYRFSFVPVNLLSCYTFYFTCGSCFPLGKRTCLVFLGLTEPCQPIDSGLFSAQRSLLAA